MPKDYGTPGPRAIYPDVCTSRTLAATSIRAQLLFDRLISQADDQGRIEGTAIVIKALCVPLVEELTARVVENLLDELTRSGLIVRYGLGGHVLVQIVTWWRWQAGMRRAYPSRWPSPEGWIDYVFGLGDGTPATYRDAAKLPRGARNLPAETPEVAGNLRATSDETARNLRASQAETAGNLPALTHAGLGGRAQPLPVPSAGASAKDSRDLKATNGRAPSDPATEPGSFDVAVSGIRR
jgi:hypothetical protein